MTHTSSRPLALSAEQVRLLRMRAQRLDPRPPTGYGVAQLVQDLCGVQAQDAGAASLAIGARTRDLTAADVDRALTEERAIVRTWAMRGTLHLIATADLGWLLALLGPGFAAGDRRRRTQLGLDDAAARRGVAVICDALARAGPLPRAALAAHLARHSLPATGQAPIHLIALAALEGHLCLGPTPDKEPAYALLTDWVTPGPALPRDQALVELARRYLAAYAPAALEDYVAWSGLPLREARSAWQALAGEMVAVEIAGRAAALLPTQAAALDAPPDAPPAVRLVPSFDPYLLGYRNRALAVAPEHARRIHPGGGVLHPALLVGGQAVATWRSKRLRARLEVLVTPFADLAPTVAAGLDAEVAGLGRFLNVPASARVVAKDD